MIYGRPRGLHGGVQVSTGALRRRKRADAPGILKTGDYKSNNNDYTAPVAA
jgi:hypothetical protein